MPACVQMVLAYWGIHRRQDRLARDLKMIPKAGTPGSHLRLLASSMLKVVYETGELSDLRSALDNGIPPIALVHTSEMPYWDKAFAHAVVVLAMNDKSVVLHDPAYKQAAISIALGDFQLAWDGMSNLYALLHKT
ncbi:MAG: peptidase C39 family protein [Anaerolinea sp.]|nr:peptidase C39 family protein [Anaerolinea sp.]